jgi:hypothetical protein
MKRLFGLKKKKKEQAPTTTQAPPTAEDGEYSEEYEDDEHVHDFEIAQEDYLVSVALATSAQEYQAASKEPSSGVQILSAPGAASLSRKYYTQQWWVLAELTVGAVPSSSSGHLLVDQSTVAAYGSSLRYSPHPAVTAGCTRSSINRAMRVKGATLPVYNTIAWVAVHVQLHHSSSCSCAAWRLGGAFLSLTSTATQLCIQLVHLHAVHAGQCSTSS